MAAGERGIITPALMPHRSHRLLSRGPGAAAVASRIGESLRPNSARCVMSGRSLAWVAFFGLAVPVAAAGQKEDPPKMPEKIAAPPKDFDKKRDNIDRGKVETVEYESKTVGAKRKAVVYTPPGFAKD